MIMGMLMKYRNKLKAELARKRKERVEKGDAKVTSLKVRMPKGKK